LEQPARPLPGKDVQAQVCTEATATIHRHGLVVGIVAIFGTENLEEDEI
jgi:hypothetical protein